MTTVTAGTLPAEWVDAPRTTREAFPEKYAGCDPRVDYAHLSDVMSRARAAYPEATKLVALWTPNGRVNACVEVWTGVPGSMHARARIVPEDRIGR